jgi:hypothetical protein
MPGKPVGGDQSAIIAPAVNAAQKDRRFSTGQVTTTIHHLLG